MNELIAALVCLVMGWIIGSVIRRDSGGDEG